MSCFVVSDFHVDVLVSWASLRQVSTYIMDPRLLAQKLAEANRAAYRERYGEQCEPAEAYRARPAAARALTPVQVLKACDCLDYQCADWSGWEGSTPQRALQRIRDRAILMLPGYEGAAWSLNEGVTA